MFCISRQIGPKRFWNNYRSFSSSLRSLIDFNPYNVLGVDKSASQSDIKKSYYQLVKKFHPDVNKEKDAEKRFHKIQESYELLSDKSKRAQYDQFGAAGFDSNGNTNPYADGNPFGSGNPFGGSRDPFGGMGFNFEDLFSQAFTGGSGRGGGRGQSPFVQHHVGDNIEVLKTISFKEAIFGTKIDVNYNAISTCNTCQGSGLKKGKKKNTCSTCHGTGQSYHIIGAFQMASTCQACHGTGVSINPKDACGDCHGNGVRNSAKSKTVDLPCGIKDGTRVRIPNGGDAPQVPKDAYNKTQNGDLIVRVNVQKDPVFERSNNDIILNRTIPMTTASLGGEIVVPTIDGHDVKLKIRSGAQANHTLTIPEKGVPINRNMSHRGDMRVILSVKTLVPETPLQRALLEAVADAFHDDTAKTSSGDSKLDLDEDKDNVHETYDEKDLHPSKLKKIGKMLGKFFNLKE